MKKLMIAAGAVALLVAAGCKDPDYTPRTSGRHAVKNVPQQTEETQAPKQEEAPAKEEAPVEVEEAKCKCAPGTVHSEPCKCGAADCKCKTAKPAQAKPAEEETTVYIVQRGDYLAKISKKYNVTIAAIRRLNPQIKNDIVKLGQKIKLPGKIDVGEQKVPEGALAAAPAKKPAQSAAYTGETKEYVVKNGDTLGAIAYGNGINIRQLKALNNLTGDNIRVGQKLLVPAGKASAAKAAPAKAETAKSETEAAKPVAPAKTAAREEPKSETVAEPAAGTEAAAPAVETAEPAAENVRYTVLEGEDVIGISIKFNVDPGEIRTLNNLASDDLEAGTVLLLPPGVSL